MEIKTKIPFRPVKCLEEDVQTLTPIEGYILFTTDTRKIYACIDGEYKMMGGSSGVFYGNKYLTDEEKYGDQIIFYFLHTDIDGNSLPAIDDLILNIPDGGFYRVLEINSTDIQAQRIAISGGGSGGGGGTGGGPSNEGSLVINYVTPKESSTITGIDYYIEFEIVAKDSAGDLVSEEGNATWIINGKNYSQKVTNGRNSFKVDGYLDPSLDKNKFVLMVTMNTGGVNDTTVSKTWYVKAVDLKLEWSWDYNTTNFISEDTFTLKFTPYGGINCTAHMIFDDTYIPGETYFTKEIAAKDTGRLVYSNPIPSLEYGTHTCEMYVTAEVNGITYQTPSIFNEITFIGSGTSTILSVPFYTTVATQYDTLNIPFMVYDPDQESCDVSFYVNDIRIGGDTYDRSLHYWPYTLTEYGSVKLTIMSDNEEAKKDFELVINHLDLEVEEVSGSAFTLKAQNFSSNSEIREWEHNGVTLSFSDNFDWENGGLQTELAEDGSIQKYICVRQGTRMTINYNLFEATNTARDGKNFKICFKATNAYDYEAPILECYEDITKLGIKLDAQKGLFSTSTYPNFATQYYENSYIELETEIWPNVADPDPSKNLYGDRFLMFWVDGVPAGVKPYPTSEKFQHRTPVPIVVGSDLCDVYIYTMKAYERRLTENEHLDNFIMDAPNTNEMLRRFRRNDIIDNSGEISYEKLVQKNPECHAYVYRMPYMTTSKNDKVKDCDYFELYGQYNTINNPYYKAIHEQDGKGVRLRVQGTSSAAYGVAAFNLRSEFQEGLLDKDGNFVEGWQVTDTAIPVDYVCTKVNVASCENANNVANAEWYNKFQPYHDAHRRKTREDGLLYRDCMEFRSGVIFVLDENTRTDYYGDDGKPSRDGYLNSNIFLDTKDYTLKPYYKMYSIGNMGNDKKNVEVFHDITNPRACCVEVTDNQNAEHWMTVPVDMGTFDLEDLFYEFRYPDGNSEASIEMKQGWVDFVNWMAASNPNGGNDDHILTSKMVDLTAETYKPNTYYKFDIANGVYLIASGAFDSSTVYYEIIPAAEGVGVSVKFEPYTFKGFDPPGYEGKENPTGISLKGTTINEYAGTYTNDTKQYRMAKMLAECEEHLVMDSVVFHYLYIQRHTMVDNVAKNTFWSSEDCQHWDLTKNYDNDTADGNDNSGYLTFTYGIEIFDKDEAGDDIYNASQSVWLNFIHGLGTAQKVLHKALEGKGAWSAKPYLDEFKKHQDVIPERCWIYDYFRKYIRPRRLGLDEDTYLNRLEGGKKTHQRTQYETYQEFYINSKYMAGTIFTDGAAIDLRLNTNPQTGFWDTRNTFPVSFYVDCYASCHLGGNINQSGRIKRGNIYEFPVGTMVSNPHDATCYIYGANMLQTLQGLSEVYPNYANLSTAAKLRQVEFGSDAEGYYNANLTGANIGSNAMLQNAYIQNSGVYTGMGALNLTKATQLKELKLNGSTATALELADGSVIEKLYLNPLSTLIMSNLTRLNDIRLDDEVKPEDSPKETSIFDTLTSISVKNCPAFDSYSYELALRAPINYYVFNDFVWNITENSDTHFDLVDGEVVGIKVLDKLLQALTQEGYTTSTALSGIINIDVDCVVDEFKIYKKYCKQYPNLIINYTNKVSGLNPAVELKFMGGEGESAAIHYRVLGSGNADGDSIGALISAEGPTGIAMTDPVKGNTSQNTYEFTGYWRDNAGNRYYKDGLVNADGSAINFNSVIPTTDMVFIPIFLEKVRKHEIKFFDYEGNVILQNGEETFGVPYGSTYTAAGGPMTNFYYLDSSKLPEDKRYGFRGWTTAKFSVDEGKNIEFFNLEKDIVKKAMNLYPYYETESVYDTASKLEYFEVKNGTINIKEQYRNTLKGKITLPDIDGVHTVGDFQKMPEITHVYFLKNSNKYTSYGAWSFYTCPKLVKVDTPISITTIGNYTFSTCHALIDVNLHNGITSIGEGAFEYCDSIQINELPINLEILGAGAFRSCGKGLIITTIPQKLIVLPDFCFVFCPNVKITTFGSKDGITSNLYTIGNQCLYNAGNGTEGGAVSSITIYDSVQDIRRAAFQYYAYNSLKSAYFTRPDTDYDINITEMGFSNSVDYVFGYIEESV